MGCAIPRQVVLGWVRKRTVHEVESKPWAAFFCHFCFSSHPDFSQWWSVTLKDKLTSSLSSPMLLWTRGFYDNNKAD